MVTYRNGNSINNIFFNKMIELIEKLYQTNQISEEVKVQLIDKYYNK